MEVELVSTVCDLSDQKKLAVALDAINRSKADLLLFCGHTIGFVNDIETLKGRIDNTHTYVVLELRDMNSSKLGNCLYKINGGNLQSMHTNQLFTTSHEIERNYQLGERLLNEFQTRRTFQLFGLNFLVIQCGELNFLKNLQSQNNCVEFRLSNHKELSTKFRRIMNGTDVFLNPIHTPMGNQGKMVKRRIFLSKNKRYYFSTSNTKPGSLDTGLSSLQYASFNGKPIDFLGERREKDYVVKNYSITTCSSLEPFREF